MMRESTYDEDEDWDVCDEDEEEPAFQCSCGADIYFYGDVHFAWLLWGENWRMTRETPEAQTADL